MKRKMLLILSLCLSLFLIISGCNNSAAKKPMTPTPQKKMTNQAGQLTDSERRVMASRLSNMAEQVKGVKKATVVVTDVGMSNSTSTPQNTTRNMTNQTNTNTGQTKSMTKNNDDIFMNNQARGVIVMVGLTLDENGQKMAASIQKQVNDKLKASDKRITQVLVSTDPNMIKRINDVAAGIVQGKPIKTFQKDLTDLTNQLRQKQPVL